MRKWNGTTSIICRCKIVHPPNWLFVEKKHTKKLYGRDYLRKWNDTPANIWRNKTWRLSWVMWVNEATRPQLCEKINYMRLFEEMKGYTRRYLRKWNNTPAITWANEMMTPLLFEFLKKKHSRIFEEMKWHAHRLFEEMKQNVIFFLFFFWENETIRSWMILWSIYSMTIQVCLCVSYYDQCCLTCISKIYCPISMAG